MCATFNCGIGLVLVIKKEDVTRTKEVVEAAGEKAFIIGEIVEGERGVVIG